MMETIARLDNCCMDWIKNLFPKPRILRVPKVIVSYDKMHIICIVQSIQLRLKSASHTIPWYFKFPSSANLRENNIHIQELFVI